MQNIIASFSCSSDTRETKKKSHQELNETKISIIGCETVSRQECSAKVRKVARKERKLYVMEIHTYTSGAEGLGWSDAPDFQFLENENGQVGGERERAREKDHRVVEKYRAAAIKKINEVVPFR